MVGWFQGSMCFCLYFCRWNAQSPINHRGLLGKSSFFMGDVQDLFGWFYYLNPRTFRKPEKSASRKYLWKLDLSSGVPFGRQPTKNPQPFSGTRVGKMLRPSIPASDNAKGISSKYRTVGMWKKGKSLVPNSEIELYWEKELVVPRIQECLNLCQYSRWCKICHISLDAKHSKLQYLFETFGSIGSRILTHARNCECASQQSASWFITP